jgi:hypothetical protein
MAQIEDQRAPVLFDAVGLMVSLLAMAIVFLPFAFDTSPLDAVTLRVPGNQGNWWHALVGTPFFLAFPMLWLRLRSLFSEATVDVRRTACDLGSRMFFDLRNNSGGVAILVAPCWNK